MGASRSQPGHQRERRCGRGQPAPGGQPDRRVRDSWNSQQHVNYIGQDGHVHELAYKDASGWGHADLSQDTSGAAEASLPRAGSPIDGYATPWNSQQHVNYIGQDGHVHELAYKDASGWGQADLSQDTSASGGAGAASLPRAGSPIDGYATSWNSQQHVNYIGQDGHVHELAYKDASGWGHADLSQDTSGAAEASLPRAGSPIDGYATPWNSQQHVNYIGQDGHVHELAYKDASGWGQADLSQDTSASGGAGAASLPRAGSPIDGYATSWNSQQHVNYIGQDGHVHELAYKDASGWGHGDLTSAGAA